MIVLCVARGGKNISGLLKITDGFVICLIP